MNRDQKAAVIDEIAGQIRESEAIFAVDYRGITVTQAAELRTKLRESDATFRVVKNTLTERAADAAEVEALKSLLEGPTAFTFVRGDAAAAAKALADFQKTSDLLAFKGGVMEGDALDAAADPRDLQAPVPRGALPAARRAWSLRRSPAWLAPSTPSSAASRLRWPACRRRRSPARSPVARRRLRPRLPPRRHRRGRGSGRGTAAEAEAPARGRGSRRGTRRRGTPLRLRPTRHPQQTPPLMSRPLRRRPRSPPRAPTTRPPPKQPRSNHMATTTADWIEELKGISRARARRAHQGARGGVRRQRRRARRGRRSPAAVAARPQPRRSRPRSTSS